MNYLDQKTEEFKTLRNDVTAGVEDPERLTEWLRATILESFKNGAQAERKRKHQNKKTVSK